MVVQRILLYADHEAALRKKSRPVRKLNHRVKRLVKDLKDTLAADPAAAGLAAPQINVHQRFVAKP